MYCHVFYETQCMHERCKNNVAIYPRWHISSKSTETRTLAYLKRTIKKTYVWFIKNKPIFISLYIKRGKMSVRTYVRTYVHTSVTVGVASWVANDITMRMTSQWEWRHNENGACERRERRRRETHNENDVTMTIAGIWRYGDWRHVATGCTALITNNSVKNEPIVLGVQKLEEISHQKVVPWEIPT